MKNYFIIHGSFGNSQEHYIPWLKRSLEEKGYEVYAPDFPIGKDNQNYDNWKKLLNQYKDKINKDTVFIGRSIAPIFIIKYILENNLKINSLYSISGFNNYKNISDADYNYVNKTFFLKNFKDFEKLCDNRVCFISKNDPYIPYNILDEFTKDINAKVYLKENAGHFNSESGYSTFEELLSIL